MHEQIGPFRLAQHIVEIGELAALQLKAHTGHRMEPFGKAEVGLEVNTVAETPLVGTVGKGRTGTASQRNFPVIPETVRHETGEARFLGVSCAHTDVASATAANNRISFFMVNNI